MNTATDLFCSIVIPAYNVERYIKECLDSVPAAMKQSDFEQTEIIVVDDGSTDGTGRIADECAARFPNLRVIHQANAGVSCARNSGIRAAAGKYIIFADSDDYFAPNSLSTVYDYLRGNSGVDVLEYDYYELQDGTMTAKSGDYIPTAGGGGGRIYSICGIKRRCRIIRRGPGLFPGNFCFRMVSIFMTGFYAKTKSGYQKFSPMRRRPPIFLYQFMYIESAERVLQSQQSTENTIMIC